MSRITEIYDAQRYLGPTWLGRAISQTDDPWFRFCRLLRELDTSLVVERNARWLDLGCNQGQFLELVRGKYGVSGVGADDWDPSLKGFGEFEYLQRDLNQSINAGQDFSFVSALEVLEHMIDTDKFLSGCRDHLQPGGHLLLSTPNINSLRNRLCVPFGTYPAGLEYRNVIHHVRLYNVGVLRSQLSEHGFTVLWIRGVNFFPMSILGKGARIELDRKLSNAFPQLCGNVMVLAKRQR